MLLAEVHIRESLFGVNLDAVNEKIGPGRIASRDHIIQLDDYEAISHCVHMS